MPHQTRLGERTKLVRWDALARGEKYYIDDKPCRTCHTLDRYTRTYRCVQCSKNAAHHKRAKRPGFSDFANGRMEITIRRRTHPTEKDCIDVMLGGERLGVVMERGDGYEAVGTGLIRYKHYNLRAAIHHAFEGYVWRNRLTQEDYQDLLSMPLVIDPSVTEAAQARTGA